MAKQFDLIFSVGSPLFLVGTEGNDADPTFKENI